MRHYHIHCIAPLLACFFLTQGAARAQEAGKPVDNVTFYFKTFIVDSTKLQPLGMRLLGDQRPIVLGTTYGVPYRNLKVDLHGNNGEYTESFEYPSTEYRWNLKRFYKIDSGGFLAMRWRGVSNVPTGVLRFDSALNFVSQTDIPIDTVFDKAMTDLLATDDGGYVLVQYRKYIKPTNERFGYNAYAYQPYCARITPKGDTLWWRQYTSGTPDFGFTMQFNRALALRGGGFVFAGNNRAVGVHAEIRLELGLYLLKTDANGNEKWHFSRATDGSYPSLFYDVAELDDGTIAAVGSVSPLPPGVGGRAILYVFSPDSGKLLWWRNYGTRWFGYDNFSFIRRMRDGGFLLAGEKTKKIDSSLATVAWIVRTNGQGDVRWSREFDIDYWTWTKSIELTPDDGCVVLVHSFPYLPKRNPVEPINTWIARHYSLIRIGPLGEVSAIDAPMTHADGLVLGSGYPNPASGNGLVTIPYSSAIAGRISITLHDALGRLVRTVMQGPTEPGDHAISFSAAGLAPGVYHACLRGERDILTRKLVLLR